MSHNPQILNLPKKSYLSYLQWVYVCYFFRVSECIKVAERSVKIKSPKIGTQ